MPFSVPNFAQNLPFVILKFDSRLHYNKVYWAHIFDDVILILICFSIGKSKIKIIPKVNLSGKNN